MIKPLQSITLKNEGGEDTTYTLSGEYPDLTAGSAEQIISDEYTENKVPYLLRASGGNGSKREEDTLVGGTVAWNQNIVNGNMSSQGSFGEAGGTIAISDGTLKYTFRTIHNNTYSNNIYQMLTPNVVAGHVIFIGVSVKPAHTCDIQTWLIASSGNNSYNQGWRIGNAIADEWNRFERVIKRTTNDGANRVQVSIENASTAGFAVDELVEFDNIVLYDLTQMFGSTIADHIYSLETATTGAGVAWFKALFPADYYAYNAGELLSVEGVSAHLMKDADDNVVGNYPLDSSLTLRGIPKLDANNSLYYDGDTYESDGTVTRKYGIVDLGTLTWAKSGNLFSSTGLQGLIKPAASSSNYTSGLLCPKYTPSADVIGAQTGDKEIAKYTNGVIYILDSAYSTAAAFTTAMSGVYLVYELATPTTETADPYTNPQNVDPDGTEEYVTTSIVPVGHETKYFADLVERLAAIPEPPTANGTYRLIATVTGGVATLSWVAN